MSVQDGPTFKRYAANGVATVYAIPFLLIDAEDLVVTLDGAELSSGFTLAGIGDPSSTCTFAIAPFGDLLFRLMVKLQRLNDYQELGDFLSDTVNLDYDRIWQAIKELRRDAGRALSVGELEPEGISALPDMEDRAGKLLAFGPLGGPVAQAINPGDAAGLSILLATQNDPAYGAAMVGYKGRTLDRKLADIVSVADFSGADSSGLLSSVAAFNSAALASRTVLVPAGTWLIDSAVATPAYWVIEAGAVITGQPTTGAPFNIDDTSRLPGRMFKLENGTHCGLRVGDSDPWLERTIWPYSESIAELSCVSSSGCIGVMGASRTSDDPIANMACIALGGYAVNDNILNIEPSWAMYLNSYRKASTGAAYNVEADNINYGNVYDLHPYSAIGLLTTQTVNLWVTAGGGDAAAANVSAGLCFQPNPKKFNRGIVFGNGSLQTNEAIASPVGYQWAWYNPFGGVDSYTNHREIVQKTEIASALGNNWSLTKWRASGGASLSLDGVWRCNYQGCSGSSASYLGSYTQVIQRGTFSGGNARFSYDIVAKDDAGTESQVTLNGLANKSFAPFPDNSISLGVASFRWSVVYAATGTINTSDERAKQDIGDIDAAALRAWAKVKYCQFKFRDAAVTKGDGARWHFGLVAQRVKEAFESEGLDAEAYGLLCHDSWDAHDEVLGESGEVIQPKVEAGDRYGIRYEEALALECAYLRSKIEAMELPHD